MVVLIIGASGQDGHYLSALCRAHGARVVGAGRRGPDVRLDVSDFPAVRALIRDCCPDYVFQLAAESTVEHRALFANHDAIGAGTLHTLESCWSCCRGARVFVPGSAVQFANRGEPIDETSPFEASSPYAASRIHAVYLARYFRSLGLRCYVGYLFHHDSPLRSSRHLSQKIARAAAEIAGGRIERLTVDSLSTVKEFTFAGDTVRAIWTLVRQDDICEAAIGSGQGFSVAQWIDACFGAAGIDWRLWIDQKSYARTPFERLVCNPSTIKKLGWQPEVTLHQLAAMMVAAARAKAELAAQCAI